jgi:transposase
MVQVEVITGIERRRSWTEDQKRAFVEEAFSPGGRAKDVMRRHDIPGSSLYCWRRQFLGLPAPKKRRSALTQQSGSAFAPSAFTPVVTAPETGQSVIEIEIGSSRIRIPASVTPELAAAIVRSLVGK